MSEEVPPGRSLRKWIPLVAAVALLALGVAVWWLVMSRGQIPVPDLNGKMVDDAKRIIADAQLKFLEEQQEENGTREGFVIAQDPAPSSKVQPGSSVKIVVAVAPKPKMVVDVSGRWDSTSNSRYDVVNLGSDFFFRSISQGPSPERMDERGNGSISESTVTVQWDGGNDKRPTSGRVVYKDDKGIAQAMQWNNGMIWFRIKEEGSDLVRHYNLDRYDRTMVIEAIKKDAKNAK